MGRDAMLIAKVGGEAIGLTFSAMMGVFAAGESAALTTSAIVAVLGFAGLLVRQVVAGQKAVWEIARAMETRAEAAEEREEFVRWQLEHVRFRHGERPTDPGPFVSRRPTVPAPLGATS